MTCVMAAPTLTLSNREILHVHEGLASLDGVVDKTGASTEITRFEFNDDLSWDIAKHGDIFERAVTVYQKERKKKAAKLGVVDGMKLTEENAGNVAAYQAAEEELLDRTQTLNGVLKLSRKALQTGNAIPPSVLKKLMPILKE